MSVRIAVAHLDDVPEGCSAATEIDGHPIALFNVHGRIYALDDTCSHAQASLAEGDLDEENCAIECPLHGSAFDLATGEVLTLPATDPVRAYPVVIDNQTIYLDVPDVLEAEA